MALRDAGDLRILDELVFVTGRKVFVAAAPEVRIYQALEKYYGKLRAPRFALLAEKLSRPRRTPSARPANEPPAPGEDLNREPFTTDSRSHVSVWCKPAPPPG